MKGRGYAGVVKRHGFATLKESHGGHFFVRHAGSIGSRKPAIAATWPVRPATASPTRSAAIRPRVVRTPVTRPPRTSMPVTAQS